MRELMGTSINSGLVMICTEGVGGIVRYLLYNEVE
jgi:hypothetical protein